MKTRLIGSNRRRRSPSGAPWRRNSAFSLVELMVVILIMIVTGFLAAGGLGVWRSTGVTTAGDLVREDLAFARELAISSNYPVELWFLQSAAKSGVTGMRIYTIDQDGNSTPYGRVHPLPPTLILDSGPLSTLCTMANQQVWTAPVTQPSIPGYGTSYTAWYIRFMPDGSTTLAAPTTQWYVTLHDLSLGAPLTSLPANYAIVSVDYLTGTARLYRP